jgi:hypothetical protein
MALFLSYLPCSRFLWTNTLYNNLHVSLCSIYILTLYFRKFYDNWRSIKLKLIRTHTNPGGIENLGLLCIWEQAIYDCINCRNRIKAHTCITERNIFVYIWNSGIRILEQRTGGLLSAVLIHELYKGRRLLIAKSRNPLLATNIVQLEILIMVTMRSTVSWYVI